MKLKDIIKKIEYKCELQYRFNIGDIVLWTPRNKEFKPIFVAIEEFGYDEIDVAEVMVPYREYYKVYDLETGKKYFAADWMCEKI